MGENTHSGHFLVKCTGTLELVLVHFWFWSFLAKVYRYTLEVYRYTLFWFSYSDQFSYFGHNLLIAYPS